ncbi:MAG: hypothetical protein OHK0045_22730 [Raineya sp.]
MKHRGSLRLELAGSLQFPKDFQTAKAVAQSFEVAFEGENVPIFLIENFAQSPAPENQYVRIPFRAITATIVGGYSWKATDFSQEGVLKKATKMLVGKPAFKNHGIGDIENIIGVVESAKWTEANGDVPAGIDIIFKIDASKHPNIVASLTSSPPEIQSCSITVDFDWSPSHPDLYKDENGNFDYYEFLWDVGTIAQDGRMVCRVVDEIHEMYECSLVGIGADPYAKILDENGKPFNIDRGTIVKLSTQEKSPFIFIKEEKTLSKQVFQEAITEAYSRLGKAYRSLQDEKKNAEQAKNMLTQLQSTLQELQTKLHEQKAKNQAYEQESISLRLKAEKYDFYLQKQKQEVERLYRVAKGSQAQEAVIKLIQQADEQQLEAFALDFGGNITEKFSGFCKDCKSNNVVFRSTEQKEIPLIAEMSKEDYQEKFKGKSMKL